MSIRLDQLEIKSQQGMIALDEIVSADGYWPPTHEDGIKVTVTNRSRQRIEWMNVDVGLHHDSQTSERISGDGDQWDYTEYTTISGMETIQLKLGAIEPDCYAWAFKPTASSKYAKTSEATEWTIIRAYGATADGRSFVHQIAVGAMDAVSVNTRSSQCFVATAAYQDPDHPIVRELRLVRDELLQTSRLGRELIKFYYRHGPKLAAIVAPRPTLRMAARAILTPATLGVKAIRSVKIRSKSRNFRNER